MSFTIAAIVGGGAAVAGIVGSGIQSGRAKRDAKKYEATLAALEANRQDITNPYANISNPFANLQVATGAAKLQAQEADISLATTLDTLRDTGASAGGATALAQAALRSKQGIANNIQQQEANNAQLRARGEQSQEQMLAQGEVFRFNAQENRENQLLDRTASLGQESRRIQRQSQQDMFAGLTSLGANAASFGTGFSSGANPQI